MAEWSIAAVLKTVEGQTSGGSNPSLSAKKTDAPKGAFLFSECEKLAFLNEGNKNAEARSAGIYFLLVPSFKGSSQIIPLSAEINI